MYGSSELKLTFVRSKISSRYDTLTIHYLVIEIPGSTLIQSKPRKIKPSTLSPQTFVSKHPERAIYHYLQKIHLPPPFPPFFTMTTTSIGKRKRDAEPFGKNSRLRTTEGSEYSESSTEADSKSQRGRNDELMAELWEPIAGPAVAPLPPIFRDFAYPVHHQLHRMTPIPPPVEDSDSECPTNVDSDSQRGNNSGFVARNQSGVEAMVVAAKKRKREEPEEPEELPASTRVRLDKDLPVLSAAVKRPASFATERRGPAKFTGFKWLVKQAWKILAGSGRAVGGFVGLPQPQFWVAKEEEGGCGEAERLERMERTRAWVATQVRPAYSRFTDMGVWQGDVEVIMGVLQVEVGIVNGGAGTAGCVPEVAGIELEF